MVWPDRLDDIFPRFQLTSDVTRNKSLRFLFSSRSKMFHQTIQFKYFCFHHNINSFASVDWWTHSFLQQLKELWHSKHSHGQVARNAPKPNMKRRWGRNEGIFSENQFNTAHDMFIKPTKYLQNGGCGSRFSLLLPGGAWKRIRKEGACPQKGGGAFKAHSTRFADFFKFFCDLF